MAGWIVTDGDEQAGLENVIEMARNLASERRHRELPDDRRVFDLVRRMHGCRVLDAESCRQAVEAYCIVTGEPFRPRWTQFNIEWQAVRFPNYGDDGLGWAAEQARCSPVPLPVSPPPVEEDYEFLGSVAWHLSERNNEEPFLLPVKRLGAELGYDRLSTISGMLFWLKNNEVIVCVDEHYDFKRGRAKKYKLGDYLTQRDDVTKKNQESRRPVKKRKEK